MTNATSSYSAYTTTGWALVEQGEVEEGFACIDEAAAAAVGVETGPLATAIVYCNTISACRDVADYRRASDWTEATKRWCDRQTINGFPGMCRVYRAEVMRLRGEWGKRTRTPSSPATS
jgi:hypothetical protein